MRDRLRRGDATLSHVQSPGGHLGPLAQPHVEVDAKQEETMWVELRREDATLSHVLSPSGPAGAHAQPLVEVEAKQEEAMWVRWRGGVVTQRGVRVSVFSQFSIFIQ